MYMYVYVCLSLFMCVCVYMFICTHIYVFIIFMTPSSNFYYSLSDTVSQDA